MRPFSWSDIDEKMGTLHRMSSMPGYVGFVKCFTPRDFRLSRATARELPPGFTYDVRLDLDNERIWLDSPGNTAPSSSGVLRGLCTVLRTYGVGVGERIPLCIKDGVYVLRLDNIE